MIGYAFYPTAVAVVCHATAVAGLPLITNHTTSNPTRAQLQTFNRVIGNRVVWATLTSDFITVNIEINRVVRSRTPGWDNFPLAAHLGAILGVPVPLENLLGLDLVIVGGPLARCSPIVLEAARRMVRLRVLPIVSRERRLICSTLGSGAWRCATGSRLALC